MEKTLWKLAENKVWKKLLYLSWSEVSYH